MDEAQEFDEAPGSSEAQPARITLLALAFEGGLGALALTIGWLVGHWPAIGMEFSPAAAGEQVAAIAWGLAATGPLLVALLILDRFPIGPIQSVKDIARDLID